MTKNTVSALPLLRHFDPDSPLALVNGATISAQRFLDTATALASCIPQARHVINLCEDRYHFLLGFAAALIARQITLMPSSRAVDAIAQLQDDFKDSYCLSDLTLTAMLEAVENGSTSHAIPLIPADQDAAILFTSGSTGQPTAHRKTWGMLVQGAEQMQRAFCAATGSCVIGTVPPQHMFGLESTIMFPLQNGCAIHHGRPHLPSDIEQAVRATSTPIWLMTTPLHLRACVEEGTELPGIVGAISATMPLDQATAQAAEKILHCPVHEMYGCTEAGLVASRRPAMAITWNLCPDLALRQDGEQSWLTGARVVRALALADRLEMHDATSFSLHGRSGDMIKLAGKRTSLAALNSALLAIDGVADGTFYQTDTDTAQDQDHQRLTAFVVSDRLNTRQIIAALRAHIDPVFIPRPIWKVAQLPRDANGKLPRSALAALASKMSETVNTGAALHYDGQIDPDHPTLEGHFPGNPIVPGVLLLSDVIGLAARRYRVGGIKQAKFHAPLRPQQTYRIEIGEPTSTSVKFTIHHEQRLIASGMLQLIDKTNV